MSSSVTAGWNGVGPGLMPAKEPSNSAVNTSTAGACAAPATMEMKAGGVTFHHGCNFHYAGPNATDQPRRAHAIIYIPDFVAFTGGGEAAGAGSEMKAGGPWDHPLHPIVAGKE